MTDFVVNESEAGERLDKMLASRFPDYSRTLWQQAVVAGQVTVNNQPALPRYLLRMGDRVVAEAPDLIHEIEAALDIKPIGKELPILYEDANVIVINKPVGLITHPAHAHNEDSVVHRLIAHDYSIKDAVYDATNPKSVMRPGIVHRLDKDTSGVLIIAKTKTSMAFLAKQIQTRTVKKLYQTLLYGWLEQPETVVNTWLNRDTSDRRKMTVTKEGIGREAKTIFRLKSTLTTLKGEKATLVEAEPITGRTHQIRVHAAQLHHPVLGDQVYTIKEARDFSDRLGLKRQFLHADQLTIRLPGETTPRTFTAPLPDDLEQVFKQFRSEI